MKEFMTHQVGINTVESPQNRNETGGYTLIEAGLMPLSAIIAIGAVVLFAHFLKGLSSEPEADLLQDLFYSVMAEEDYVVAVDRDQLDTFAPFAKSGVIVAPDGSYGMRPVLFCINGADDIMNSMIGDWDGLNVAKETLMSARERVLVERCQVALKQ